MRRAVAVVWLLAGLLAAVPAGAKILKTRRPDAYRPLELTVGSGLEFETDGEESEYGFPVFAEYGVTRSLRLSIEPGFVFVKQNTGNTVTGFGDLETTLTWEFVHERRNRPALTALAGITWPTARRGDLGTGKTDLTLGAIVDKEFDRLDLDFNASYTFVGDPPRVQLRDTFEASVAAEWHLSALLDLEAEAVTAVGAAGSFQAAPGSLDPFANIGGPEQGQTETEFTLGLAENLGERLKLEQGAIMKSDGAFQLVLGWEYEFGEGR